jgi:hypothetical protein
MTVTRKALFFSICIFSRHKFHKLDEVRLRLENEKNLCIAILSTNIGGNKILEQEYKSTFSKMPIQLFTRLLCYLDMLF